MAAKKESAAHQRYMEKYKRRLRREQIIASGVLAAQAGIQSCDWVTFYTKLYKKLGLEAYLPSVLNELRRAE